VKPVIVKAKGRKKQNSRDLSAMQRELLEFQEAKYIEHAQKHADARGLFAELENVTGAALGCSRSTVSRILKRCADKKKVRIVSPAHYDKKTGKQTLNIIQMPLKPCASVTTDQVVEDIGTKEKEVEQGNPCSSENAHTTVCNSSSDCVSDIGCSSRSHEVSRVNTVSKPKNIPALVREERTELGFWESSKNTAKAEACRKRIAELETELTRDGGAS
jgi:hypothetical protein